MKNSTKKLEPGDQMPDGTIFAGLLPELGRNMFVTPTDAPGTLKWKAAMKYAADLDAHGHRDWKLPTKAELDVLYQNRHKGALQGTFNESGSSVSDWYWSSTEAKDEFSEGVLVQSFSADYRGWNLKNKNSGACVRPVRLDPCPIGASSRRG